MPSIQIDKIDYDTKKLSQKAKVHLTIIQVCGQETRRLKAQLAIA